MSKNLTNTDGKVPFSGKVQRIVISPTDNTTYYVFADGRVCKHTPENIKLIMNDLEPNWLHEVLVSEL